MLLKNSFRLVAVESFTEVYKFFIDVLIVLSGAVFLKFRFLPVLDVLATTLIDVALGVNACFVGKSLSGHSKSPFDTTHLLLLQWYAKKR